MHGDMLSSHRYQEVGVPVFVVFFGWKFVVVVAVNPEDVKVWSLKLCSYSAKYRPSI